jgi:signal transduction histidine kinase
VASGLVRGVRRAGRDVAYLALGAVLGGIWLCALTLGALVLLVLVGGLIGAPVAVWILELARRAGELERRSANRLLRVAIPASTPVAPEADARARLRALAAAGSTWRAVAWLLLREPLALLAGTILWALLWFATSLGLAPFGGALVGAAAGVPGAALIAAVALVLLAAQVLWASSEAHARLALTLLGPSAREQVASLQQRTAELDLRAALARDLHDSVGHSVTASLLQASAARRVLASDPAFAARALQAIEDQSRGALEQLDRVLGALRSGQIDADGEGDLDSLDRLFANVRTAGTALTVERRGDLEGVPGPLAREGFRIVQEGLTNVLRHAAGADARVTLERADRWLAISVENGSGVALDDARERGGEGLRGITERVGSLGGELTYGPLLDGGFGIRVKLPFDPA